MKKITFLCILLFTAITFAQQGINYKAVIKDNLGNVVVNDLISVQFTILKGATQVNVYRENHTPTTDANGIVILNIGKGTPLSGTFTTIDWGSDDHYLNVQINTGNGLVDMGTIEFMAVPYALHAKNVDGAVKKINDLTDAKSDADGSSVFLGQDAGLNDDGTDNHNTGVGYKALYSNTTGYENTAYGSTALYSNTTGYRNLALGERAMYSNTIGFRNTANGNSSLYSNTSGFRNTANGNSSLYSNTYGSYNTANGQEALYNNTTGDGNTAIGSAALYYNTTGIDNIAIGSSALYYNTTGNFNVANGIEALKANSTGDANTAIGSVALASNTTGYNNTAIGNSSLRHNTTGYDNTASGSYALSLNITGVANVASGKEALKENTTGNFNTASGYQSLSSNTTGFSNTANGMNALDSNTTGDQNTAMGYAALSNVTTGNNNTAIGFNANVPFGFSSNQVRIGNSSVTYAGVQVAWTYTSDRLWKDQIRELPYGLNLVKQLKPVDYIRKNNEASTREMGFIAQDIEDVLAKVGYTDQGFLTKDSEGNLGVRYNDLIALLTKAVQEQQTIIENQQKQIDELKVLVQTQLNKN